jgi:UDPglucose--hexose-1-phosphate uridylyltransferase
MKEKLAAAREYFLQKDRNLFEDILRNEIKAGERLVFENAGFASFCPFASRFSFETCIMPKQQSADFYRCSDHDLVMLADMLKKTLRALRTGLDRPSYNLVLHTAPMRWPRPGHWQTLDFDFRWHVEILPRLAGVAGFEFGTGFYINPVLPETAAQFLRGVKAGPEA